jgi:hypothetical protein
VHIIPTWIHHLHTVILIGQTQISNPGANSTTVCLPSHSTEPKEKKEKKSRNTVYNNIEYNNLTETNHSASQTQQILGQLPCTSSPQIKNAPSATPKYDLIEIFEFHILGTNNSRKGKPNMGSTDTLPTLDSLYFPSAQQSISQTLSSLRRSALSVSNRLQSIETDAIFVQEVADYYDLPLVANERCGSWYIPPTTKAGSAYFKSTDGHSGQWDFSLRRLNLQLLSLAKKYGGYV